MAEHVINFVEGEGISIQASESADQEKWDVEIASTVTATASTPSDPADDTAVWMPLFDTDGALVLDSDGGLIPTLIPI